LVEQLGLLKKTTQLSEETQDETGKKGVSEKKEEKETQAHEENSYKEVQKKKKNVLRKRGERGSLLGQT